ncbi:procollagen-lysine 5-dioxygenase [Aureococcus anophagefferens]|nr:procollagen-lysine 5-dioxygenase [Aureococcus anophagefferens]
MSRPMVDESRLEPLAFVQRLRNRRCVVVCQHCGAACGGSEHPLLHCVAKRCPLSRDALAQALKEHDVRGVSPKCVVYCRKGCGETYCGNACEAAARAAGHGSLCCGPLKEDDPMVQFRVQAMESGLFDEFVLAAKVLALAAERPKGAARLAEDRGRQRRRRARASRACGPRPSGSSSSPARRRWPRSGDAAVFARLVGYVAGSRSPPSGRLRRAYCKGAVDAAEQQFLLDWLREDTDEQRRPTRSRRSSTARRRTATTRTAKATALDFATSPSTRRSTSKASRAWPSSRRPWPWTTPARRRTPRRRRAPGRQRRFAVDGDRKTFAKRTVARCEAAVDVEERGEALFKRGLGDCGCAGGASTTSTGDAGRTPGHRAPRDADALYGRARVTGWMDRWSAERRLMRAALDLAPDDARIRKHVGDADAYHAGACDVAGWAKRRVPFEALERPASDDDDDEPPGDVRA